MGMHCGSGRDRGGVGNLCGETRQQPMVRRNGRGVIATAAGAAARFPIPQPGPPHDPQQQRAGGQRAQRSAAVARQRHQSHVERTRRGQMLERGRTVAQPSQRQPPQPRQPKGRRPGEIDQHRRAVMELAVILRRIRAQLVRQQHGRAQQQHLRRKQGQPAEGQQQPAQRLQPRRFGGNRPYRLRLGEEAARNVQRRIAQRAVPLEVTALRHAIDIHGVGRDDDKGRHIEPGQPSRGQQPPPPHPLQGGGGGTAEKQAAPRRPQPQHSRQQRHFFLDRCHQDDRRDHLPPTARLHRPQRPQHQRHDQRRGVELGEQRGLGLGREQIAHHQRQRQRPRQLAQRLQLPDMRLGRGGQRAIQQQQGQPIERPCAQRHHHRLQDQQRAHIVPHPEDGTDQREDRLHMIGQARGDIAIVGGFHKTAAAGIPDGLIHLAQVGLMRAHARVLGQRQPAKDPHIDGHQPYQQQPVGVKQGQPLHTDLTTSATRATSATVNSGCMGSDRISAAACSVWGRARAACAA